MRNVLEKNVVDGITVNVQILERINFGRIRNECCRNYHLWSCSVNPCVCGNLHHRIWEGIEEDEGVMGLTSQEVDCKGCKNALFTVRQPAMCSSLMECKRETKK